MSKSDQDRQIARARERADLARLRFSNAVSGVLDRLTPDRLRAEAIEIAADQLEQTRRDLMQRFRYWPVAAASVAAAGVTIAFWRPARVAARYGLQIASFVWSTRNLWRPKE
jgi:hypothetical protein